MQITYHNGKIDADEVIKFLALSGRHPDIFNEVIKGREVLKKAGELGISATDESIQEFADAFRGMRGLYTTEETLSYLKTFGLSETDFEQFCESAVITRYVKDHFATEEKVKEYFLNHRSEFDRARISHIVVGEESHAKEIIMQVSEDEEDFHALARKHSVDDNTRYTGGYLGLVSRAMLPPEIAAKVFSAASGDLLGPYQVDALYENILVEEILPAELNEVTAGIIKDIFFDQWLSGIAGDGIRIE